MSKQIIFCVETNGKARTDIVYIKDTIRKFYNDYSGINFEYVPMGTKTAFNNKSIICTVVLVMLLKTL